MVAIKEVGRGRAGLALLLWLLVPGLAAARPTGRFEQNAVLDVIERIKAKDCDGAVKLLQAGLAANSPRLALLAGNMYEQGICLKPNLDRAAGYYITAHNGGERAAAYRLAAAYARREAGPDTAAALWWLRQANKNFAAEICGVDDAAADDPDRFVAALQAWTPARLAACNYVAGVSATIAGEAQYPRTPHLFEPEGTVIVRFTPALPKIDIWTEARGGLFTEPRPSGENDQPRAIRASRFEKVVRDIADRALARYPQPAGIDPAWVHKIAMVFNVQSD